MTIEYVKCLEYFCAWKLHCYVEDLEELSKVYSKLAESVNFELKEDDKYLDDILFSLLRKIVLQVCNNIYNICENEEIVEYVDTNNNVRMYKVEGTLKEDLLSVAEKIAKADPFILSDDPYGTSFDSILDKTIDYDSDIECNIDYLIKYLLKNNLVRVGEKCKEED